MNFSQEEIFSMYGQYDKFIRVEFHYESEEYGKFGLQLMGSFIYTLEERNNLENTLNQNEISRTEKKIKFKPSELENLTTEQKIDLDKNGILCSSISSVYATDLPRSNRFIHRGKKDFQNVMHIKAPEFRGWEELNRVQFGFLNSRYSDGKELAPKEKVQYWAFRKHFNIDKDKPDYIDSLTNSNYEFQQQVRLEELRIKYQESSIAEEEIEEFVKLVFKEIEYKNEIINKEIERSTEKINAVSVNYGTEIENLKLICRKFDEKIIAFGDRLIYLEFERFVHIFARHVADTQIGERFAENKTVFQYKFEDIISLIKMVIESVGDEIENHFKTNPTSSFRRMGKRSVYFDGHYYRIDIEPDGRLKDFHPYNDDENTGANNINNYA